MPDLDTPVVSAPPAKRSYALWAAIASLIVALAAGATFFGVPAWRQHERRLRATQTAAEVQQFVKLFETFASEHGEWPPAAAPGESPAGMESRLRDTAWTQTTPIGGSFAWLIDAAGVHAAIAVDATDPKRSLDPRDVDELKRTLRAGGFAATRIRQNDRGAPVFVLED